MTAHDGLTVAELTVRIAGLTVVDQLTLTAAAGTILAITGPAGSGKSTLLAALAGNHLPVNGRIELDGEPITSHLAQQRIGYLPQTVAVLDALTAVENVALPLLARNVATAEAWQCAQQQLDLLGMPTGTHHNLAEQLSGGQRQRVAFARTTVHHPALLLADDPTSELDADTAHRTLNLIKDLTDKGTTAVIVTNDPAIEAITNQRIRLTAHPQRPGRHSTDNPEQTYVSWP